MWMVCVSFKGGYKFHSAHTDLAKAQEWANCRSHDGDDVTIVHVSKDDCEELTEVIEKMQG